MEDGFGRHHDHDARHLDWAEVYDERLQENPHHVGYQVYERQPWATPLPAYEEDYDYDMAYDHHMRHGTEDSFWALYQEAERRSH